MTCDSGSAKNDARHRVRFAAVGLGEATIFVPIRNAGAETHVEDFEVTLRVTAL